MSSLNEGGAPRLTLTHPSYSSLHHPQLRGGARSSGAKLTPNRCQGPSKHVAIHALTPHTDLSATPHRCLIKISYHMAQCSSRPWTRTADSIAHALLCLFLLVSLYKVYCFSLPIYMSHYPSVSLFLSLCLPGSPFFFHPPPPIYLSIHLSLLLSICPSPNSSQVPPATEKQPLLQASSSADISRAESTTDLRKPFNYQPAKHASSAEHSNAYHRVKYD